MNTAQSAAATTTKNYKPETVPGATMFYNYGYDQLNRLTKMDAYNGFTPDSNSWTGNGSMMNPLDIWKERIAYDANGNIQKYKRNGAAGGFPLEMDSLVYNYYAGTNKLKYIHDSVPAAAYPNAEYFSDLDKQPDSNYVYDAIGNLVKDSSEGITSIKWSVYGKILEINKNATNPSLATHIIYTYDAQGNRISKTTEQAGNNYKKIDWYVRDAQGNTIAIYTAEGGLSANLSDITPKVSEWHIYGSSLLGTYNKQEGMNYGPGRWSWQSVFSNYPRGLRRYQLSNHLGNVEAVITDKKIAVASSDTSSLIAYYKPDINAAEDYYPFGWAMPGRTWEANRLYRYGFNGKEYDNEVKGKWNQQDYGMRIYDPRVGRFLSVDPLTRSYPILTPYQFASNRPIDGIDMDGLEFFGAGWLIDEAAEGLSKLGMKRTAGFVSSYGHSLIIDPAYSSYQNVQKIKQGEYVEAAKDYDPTGLSRIPDIYRTGKAAVNGDEFAQGQVLGLLPSFYGIFRGYKGVTGKNAKAATTTEAATTEVQTASNNGVSTKSQGTTNAATLSPTESAWVENFVKNRPGVNRGVFNDKALSTNALRELSNQLGGVEVMQVFVKTKNGGYYNVFYGSTRAIELPNFEGGTPYLINHVHPSGNTMPSTSDINLLRTLQQIQKKNGMPVQSSSQIVPVGNSNQKFNTSSETKGN